MKGEARAKRHASGRLWEQDGLTSREHTVCRETQPSRSQTRNLFASQILSLSRITERTTPILPF